MRKPYLSVLGTSSAKKAISQHFLRSGWLLHRLAALCIQWHVSLQNNNFEFGKGSQPTSSDQIPHQETFWRRRTRSQWYTLASLAWLGSYHFVKGWKCPTTVCILLEGNANDMTIRLNNGRLKATLPGPGSKPWHGILEWSLGVGSEELSHETSSLSLSPQLDDGARTQS